MFANNESSIEWAKNCPADEEKLKTLDFGTAMHTIALEPEKFHTEFLVMPEFNGRSNAGKEEKAAWIAEHNNVKIVTTDEHKKLGLMFESLMADPYARKLLTNDGIAEQSHFAVDKDSGVLCKCRPDRNIYNSPILVDLKTTDLISKFHYSIDDYGYYKQAPFYLDIYNESTGEEKDTFIFLVIQKTIELGRYPVRCITLPQDVIDYGRREYKRNLEAYARAQEFNQYKGIYEAEMSYNFMKRIN